MEEAKGAMKELEDEGWDEVGEGDDRCAMGGSHFPKTDAMPSTSTRGEHRLQSQLSFYSLQSLTLQSDRY